MNQVKVFRVHGRMRFEKSVPKSIIAYKYSKSRYINTYTALQYYNVFAAAVSRLARARLQATMLIIEILLWAKV